MSIHQPSEPGCKEGSPRHCWREDDIAGHTWYADCVTVSGNPAIAKNELSGKKLLPESQKMLPPGARLGRPRWDHKTPRYSNHINIERKDIKRRLIILLSSQVKPFTGKTQRR